MENDLIRRSDVDDILARVFGYAETEGEEIGVIKINNELKRLPAVDAVEVVRCRECNKWEEYENTAGCGYCHNKRFRFEYGGDHRSVFGPITEPDFSCMDGRREDGDT